MNIETLEEGQKIEVYTTGGSQFAGTFGGLLTAGGIEALILEHGTYLTRYIFINHITGIGVRNEDTP